MSRSVSTNRTLRCEKLFFLSGIGMFIIIITIIVMLHTIRVTGSTPGRRYRSASYIWGTRGSPRSWPRTACSLTASYWPGWSHTQSTMPRARTGAVPPGRTEGHIRGTFREHWATFWEHSGNIRATFWEHSGRVERTPVSLHPNCQKHFFKKKVPR
jgi:hypothetical protein